MNFIVKYWAQLTVLIGVLGYAFKGLFDFRLKKLELKYDVIFKERLTAVANFFHFANTVKDETTALIENILEQGEINIDEEKSNAYDMYSKAYNYAIILVPVHVSDYMFDIMSVLL